MKAKLLIILLSIIPLLMNGQDTTKAIYDFPIISLNKSMDDYRAESLLKLLIEYETDCYNDSTLIQVNVNPDRNFTGKNGSTTLVYYPPIWKDEWIHKQPILSDFIKWLHKKETHEAKNK